MQVLSEAGLFTTPGPDRDVHWAGHLRVSDLSVGTYSIAAGARDDQEPHTEDEVYVVTAGHARLEAGGPGEQTAPVGPGSVIYVPAGEPHSFVDITHDMTVIVLFAPAEYSRRDAGQ
ncbi:MAG TPA: cupin domain-containing protein [Actinobacteria bacterium]|nr:cupin domain-containing protein [Actinomycetota bacterium]